MVKSTRERSIDLPPLGANGDNLDWLETTLPSAMYEPNLSLPGGKQSTLNSSSSLAANELRFDSSNPKKQMKVGSGSNYLSNEIFYRVGRIRKLKQSVGPPPLTGHLHLPHIGNYNFDPKTDPFGAQHFSMLRTEITNTILIIKAGAAVL